MLSQFTDGDKDSEIRSKLFFVHTVNKWCQELNPVLSDPRACLTPRPLTKGPLSLEQADEKGLGRSLGGFDRLFSLA